MKCFTLIVTTFLGVLATSLAEDEVVSEFNNKTVDRKPTLVHRKRLMNDLFQDYDKELIPDNAMVTFGITSIAFDVCEEKKLLTGNFWLSLKWTDPRLQWEKDDYGAVESIRFHPSKLWIPDLTLYNSATPENLLQCTKTEAVIKPTGEVSYIIPCKIEAYCPKLNLEKDPYGEQTCGLKFGSWSYDGLLMDLALQGGENSTLDTSSLKDVSQYTIISGTGTKTVNFYKCCPEPYITLDFQIVFKKKADLP